VEVELDFFFKFFKIEGLTSFGIRFNQRKLH